MARPLRISYPGAFYHVTSRGNERKKVFNSKKDREQFLSYLESAVIRYGAVIHAYCLMDNHYHLLLETPSANLSQIMRHINGAYTTYFNITHKRVGHLFQGRFKAILVDKDAYAKELSRYIHLNPVRAKMVEAPEKYQWSSYPYYAGKRKNPDWLNINFILGYFGDRPQKASKEYQHFVTSIIDKEYESPLIHTVASALLGNPQFIDDIKKKYISDRSKDPNIPALKCLLKKPELKEICDAVDDVLGDSHGVARNAKIYIAQTHTGKSLREIGDYFNIGESGVSQATRRVVLKIQKDRKMKRLINQVETALNLSRIKT